MSIQAVVWDVDDTLFDYTTADRLGMRAHLTAEGLLDRFGGVEQALDHWREITHLQWARFSAGEATFEDQRRDRVRVGAHHCRVPRRPGWREHLHLAH